MTKEKPSLSQEIQQINHVVAVILTVGMYTTIFFYVVGLVLFFIKGSVEDPVSAQYFHSFFAFYNSLIRLQPEAFLYLGTITLILTPISRVFISIFAFMRDRDYKFVFITLLVFCVILASILLGSIFKVKIG
ncbi:MAG: DUF1634 domain-containing protein [Candidatus Kryptoniota bacterium]